MKKRFLIYLCTTFRESIKNSAPFTLGNHLNNQTRTEDFINCFPYVKIKPSLPGVKEPTVHLVVDNHTSFIMLKEIMVPFWRLEE